MKLYLFAAIALACLFSAPVNAKSGDDFTTRFDVAQAATTSTQTTTQTPTEPAQVTTVVKGGSYAADTIEWLKAVFGTALAAAALALMYRVFGYFGIQVTDSQRGQLQTIVVNGINDAAAKAATSLRNNPNLDIGVKNKIIQDAVAYTQAHGAETIKALGLDPKSGDAVEAIRARIQTAIIDPLTPTNPALDKIIDKPKAA